MKALGQILIYAFGLMAFAVAAEEPLSLENLANKVSGKQRELINRSVLPKGKEQEVLAVLRQRRSYQALFRLNDQPAIDEFMAKYREKRGLDWSLVQQLERCKAPYILDELAPSLYEGPDFENRRTTDGYHTDQGYAQTTATGMSEIIAKAPEFSEAVRKSVNERIGESPATMRAWWEKNQQALRAERYGDVLPIIRVVYAKEEPAPRKSAPAGQARSLATPTTPSLGVQEHTPAAVEANGGQRSHSFRVIALGVLAVVVFALGILIVFRRVR